MSDVQTDRELEDLRRENTRLSALVERFDGWLTSSPHRRGCTFLRNARSRAWNASAECSCGRDALLLEVLNLHAERRAAASDKSPNRKPGATRG